jgi:hypothetical protein
MSPRVELRPAPLHSRTHLLHTTPQTTLTVAQLRLRAMRKLNPQPLSSIMKIMPSPS